MPTHKTVFFSMCLAFALHTLNMASPHGKLAAEDGRAKKVIQATLILAFCFYGVALVIAFQTTFGQSEFRVSPKRTVDVMITLLAIAGAVCTLVSISYFHAELDSYSSDETPIPYSTALYTAAAVAAIFSAILNAIIVSKQPLGMSTWTGPGGVQLQQQFNPAFATPAPQAFVATQNVPAIQSNPYNPPQYVYLEPPLAEAGAQTAVPQG